MTDGPGRRPATSRHLLETAALTLFAAQGFEATTVDQVAGAAGVSRRTFFRYYASKNDVVWGDFESGLGEMEAGLSAVPAEVPLWVAVTEAVVAFNSLPPAAVPSHRQRMTLILHVPALQAHSTLRYSEWRAVIARFAARRLQQQASELGPQLVGHLALASAVTAYEAWLRDDGSSLGTLLRRAYASLELRAPDKALYM